MSNSTPKSWKLLRCGDRSRGLVSLRWGLEVEPNIWKSLNIQKSIHKSILLKFDAGVCFLVRSWMTCDWCYLWKNTFSALAEFKILCHWELRGRLPSLKHYSPNSVQTCRRIRSRCHVHTLLAIFFHGTVKLKSHLSLQFFHTNGTYCTDKNQTCCTGEARWRRRADHGNQPITLRGGACDLAKHWNAVLFHGVYHRSWQIIFCKQKKSNNIQQHGPMFTLFLFVLWDYRRVTRVFSSTCYAILC